MDPKNPILEEIRAIRDEIARSCDYDVAKIADAARERERAHPDRVVHLPPRPAVAVRMVS